MSRTAKTDITAEDRGGCICGWPENQCLIRAWGSKPEENMHLSCDERDQQKSLVEGEE